MSNPIIQRDMQHNTPHQSQTHMHTALNTAYQSDETFLTHTIKCLILPFSVSFIFPFRCRKPPRDFPRRCCRCHNGTYLYIYVNISTNLYKYIYEI